jgi:hypothetical protein
MQLDSASEKQILQSWPVRHFVGADRLLDGANALRVPLCLGLNTTWASQLFGQDLPSSYIVAIMLLAWGGTMKVAIAADAKQTRLIPNVMSRRIFLSSFAFFLC